MGTARPFSKINRCNTRKHNCVKCKTTVDTIHDGICPKCGTDKQKLIDARKEKDKEYIIALKKSKGIY